MKFIFRCIRFLLYLFTAGAFIGFISIFLIFHFFSSDLPDHTSLQRYCPDVASRVFLQDGSKLCEYSYEKRYFIPIEKIPQKLVNAFISAEDKHFYEHSGIDFIGIARSALKNLENLGTNKRPQGASTITQQIARIFLIKNNEISYIRKIKEAILSYRIESYLPKKKILELYLNQIYMGLSSYGVAAAAKTYFDKTVDELTIAECAYLASLAKGANNYHPIKNKEKAIARRNWAINRQLEDSFITKEEADIATKEDLITSSQQEKHIEAEYFSEEIRKYLIEKFPSDSLNKEGLIVRATLDTRMQKCAYNALRKGLEEVDKRFGWRGSIGKIDIQKSNAEIISALKSIKTPKGSEEFQKAVITSINNKNASIFTESEERGDLLDADVKWISQKTKAGEVILVSKIKKGKNAGKFKVMQLPHVQGAIIVIENETGRILAMQGGYSFLQSEFNRSTQAMRQSGSAFKPFVYLAALENGFAPNSVIDSSPIEIDLGDDLGIWKPRNYQGAVIDKITLRRALERSVNTATVRIAQEVGVDKIVKIAGKFNIFDKEMPEYLSFALGAGETTLLKLTTAYAMFANGGKRITPSMVDYIQDKHGNVLYKADNRIVDHSIRFEIDLPPKLNDNREQILSEQSIYQLTSLLEGVILRGSGAPARFLNFPMAGKTGTSNESRDTWFIGYTPDITIGIFVGFDEHSKSLGKNANGTNTALPIFIDFMLEAKIFLTPKPFKIPKGIKLRKIDLESGGTATENSSNSIIEAFKEDEEIDQKNIYNIQNKHSSIKDIVNEIDTEQDTLENEDSNKNDHQTVKPIFGIY